MLLLGCVAVSAGATAASADDAVTWAFAFKDDFYFNSDNQHTGGASIQMYSAVASNLSQTHGTPAFGKSLAWLPLPQSPNFFYREGWQFGQAEQTPDHLGEHRLITNDYVAEFSRRLMAEAETARCNGSDDERALTDVWLAQLRHHVAERQIDEELVLAMLGRHAGALHPGGHTRCRCARRS